MRSLYGGIAALLLLHFRAEAQVPFPPQSLLDATNQQQAIAVLGAAQSERSGYLLIDSPEVTLPGSYRVTVQSDIPGTSHLVLLKASLALPAQASSVPPQKITVYAKRLEPGAPATAKVELDAADRHNLILFAYARGRWFWVSREVKLGKPVSVE